MSPTLAMLCRELRRRLPASAGQWLRVGALCTALIAVVLGVVTRVVAGSPQSAATRVGRPAAAFALPAERDGQRLSGTVSLASERGHAVVLVFFYTLCPRCLNQVQAAATVAHDEAGRNVAVLYISSPAERPDIVSAYLDRLEIHAPALLDDGGTVATRYGIRFYPTLVLVDARGVVCGVWLGETGLAPIERTITTLG